MKNPYVLEPVIQVFAFVRSENTKGKSEKSPEMNNRVITAVVVTQFMNLCMAVMTTGNYVISACGFDLLVFHPSVFEAFFLESRLEETTAAAAAIIVRFVRGHVDEVFFTHDLFDGITEPFGYWVSETFPHDLARVLNRELDLEILVPVGTWFQLAFLDPFWVIFVDILYVEVMIDVEFVQSGPDCECYVPSFGV